MNRDNGDHHRWRVRMLLLYGTMLSAPIALVLVHGFVHLRPPCVCVFRAIFGIDCPACGITRSAGALLTGDIPGAFRFHPAGPLIVAIFAVITMYLVVVVLTNVKGLEWRKEVTASSRIEYTALVTLVIGWIGKMLMN